MLIEFKTENYKSFKEEICFSMISTPKQTGLDYSITKIKFPGIKKILKVLCSSVVYGANASGKTNVIGAMDTFRSIVLRGNIKNPEEKNNFNPASDVLELIPNNKYESPKPVKFSITFTVDNILIQYNLNIDLGTFLDADYKRKIDLEELKINNEIIFHREKELMVNIPKFIFPYLTNKNCSIFEQINQIATDSLNPEELFLTNGFKIIFSQKLVNIIMDWFANKFMVICRADSMKLVTKFADPRKKTIYVEQTTNKAAELFGVTANEIGYVVDDENSEPKLCTILKDKKTILPAEIFESYGTIRFINMFPLVIRAIQTGGTLVIDEFDASIHPKALMSIINIFHNDDLNVNHAQLIFNTHNPIFLNSNLFRRDEIKFVERNDETQESILYSLSHFGTSGDNGVRKHEDYMKNYFINEYGAIKDIDFTSIFEPEINIESE